MSSEDQTMTTQEAGQTVTAAQGSQPTIAGLRIGIVGAATREGVSKARLLLRPSRGGRAATVTVGDSIDVPGHGTVTLDSVQTHEGEPDARPRVRITVRPATSA